MSILKKWICAALLLTIICCPSIADVLRRDTQVDDWNDASAIRIVQMVQGNALHRNYADALPSLLEELNEVTTLKIAPDPVMIERFDDPALLEHPVLYINFGDRADWTLAPEEIDALRAFIDRGGFIFVDAGINASFLREENNLYGQSHSFAEWQVSPVVADAFREVYPEKSFQPLPRTHRLFSAFYQGLPDPEILPESVREYVVNEKWPQGTYAAMGLFVEGRLSVLAMPILAMGWGRNELDEWTTFIGFRIREGAEGISERLADAAYTGVRFETTREDGRSDIIYTQQAAMPAWVQEPGDRWRVFRYYYTQEISDYAHTFYTRLGVNIFVYAFTE